MATTYDGPLLTAGAVLRQLDQHNLMTPEALRSILGADGERISLAKLEMALVSNNVLSAARLSLLKSAMSGLASVESLEGAGLATLDSHISKLTGAIVLNRPALTVAFVEDLPPNVERVARALGREHLDFEIWTISAPQFVELYKATYNGEKLDTRPPVDSIFTILNEAVGRRASDVHLSVGRSPTLRVDGALQELPFQPLTRQWLEEQMEELGGADRIARLREFYDADFIYKYGAHRFRCNLGMTEDGINLAARTLPTKVPTPDDLKLPQAIRKLCDLERGLVLVTGPTGSGKSTTLAALLGEIARRQGRHIITLEDPIEFALPRDGKSVVDQREFRRSFTSFPDGLRQALRQDPDVILVGELRDQDTMRTALMAAETGHLVFSTLHTYDASSTIGRLVSAFSAEEQNQVRAQLAYILKGVVSQTLLPHAQGRGRVASYEVMLSTPAIANNLRKVDGHHQLRQAIEVGRGMGMQTMEMGLADLVRQGLIKVEDAEYRARDVEDFRRRLEALDQVAD